MTGAWPIDLSHITDCKRVTLICLWRLWSSSLAYLPIFCTNALNEQKYYIDSEHHTAEHTLCRPYSPWKISVSQPVHRPGSHAWRYLPVVLYRYTTATIVWVQDKMPLNKMPPDKMPRTKCQGTKFHQQWNLFLFSSNVVSVCCLIIKHVATDDNFSIPQNLFRSYRVLQARRGMSIEDWARGYQ